MDLRNVGVWGECRNLRRLAEERCEHGDYVAAMKYYEEAAERYNTIKAFGLAGECCKRAGECCLRVPDEYFLIKPDGTRYEPGEAQVDASALAAVGCFHSARKMYQQAGLRSKAGEMYVLEKDAMRTSEAKNVKMGRWKVCAFSWLKLSVSKYLFGYGEKPLYLLLWIFIIIFGFALAYYPSSWGFIELKGIEWEDGWLSNLGIAGYFSIVTFATLGYGDIKPGNGWARLYVCIEVLFGYAMLGSFVALMARKFTHD